MRLLQLLIWIIIALVLAKIVGIVLRILRGPRCPPHDVEDHRRRQQPERYANVQDARFEDLPDKK